MSVTASTNFITIFDSQVKQAYQGKQKLRDTVRVKTGGGKRFEFPKLGAGMASERTPQTDVQPMNVAHSKAIVNVRDWNAPEYSDIVDLDKLSFDEKKELAAVTANAMGRRLDQLILDAVHTGANTTDVVDVNVGGSNSNLNLAKMLRAKRFFDDREIDEDGRYMVIQARSLENALAVTEVTSADYNVLKPLAMGQLKSFAGFEIKVIGTRSEGGLIKATNTRTNYCYHKDAVGLAISRDMTPKVDWIAEKTSWLTNMLFSADATVIDDEGVFKLETYEA